jgi:hypothetical protein
MIAGNARRLVVAALTLAVAEGADAQIVRAGGLSPFVKDYKIDFAIPDAPAFKLLEVDQSAILRPQTVRDLVVAFDGFRGNGNAFVVPKQFGVEVSPGLVIGSGRLQLTDYAARKYLYATRLSGATSRDTANRGQLAAGIRFSIVDEQDIRSKGGGGTDPVVTAFTESIRDVYVAARRRAGPPPAPIILTDGERVQVEAVSDSIKQYWAEKYWNASSLELAVGTRAGTRDSLGHDPRVDEAAGWVTYANGLQGWGQLLVGAKLGAARDTGGTLRAANTLAARLYVGSNALKAFAEGQQALTSNTTAQWLLNSGVEFRLPSIGWLNASAGYASSPSGGKGRVISSFKYKAAFP